MRLGRSVRRRVRVPLRRSFPSVTESNCLPARPGGEQLKVNDQSIERMAKEPTTQTRYGLMRLTRLLAMNEVRRTADSQGKRIGGQARAEQEAWPQSGGAWGGWRRNVRRGLFVNQGDLLRCAKERSRRQSPRSSNETGNDRGAKGDRKVEA